jgi:hypothetical protein
MTPDSSGFRRSWVEPAAAAALFAACICALGPWWSVFELDPDEGFNLMKAALVADGHAMYAEVWSDQPPVLTYILALVERIAGGGIAWARATVLVFAMLLIASLFAVVRADFGRVGAWAACLTLGAGFLFQSLSVSVMIGLPAVALATASLALLWRTESHRSAILIASGVVMALALQTKLFVATAVPAGVLAAAAAGPLGDAAARRAARAAVWLGSTLLAWALIALASGLDPVAHLIAPHTQDGIAEAFTYDGGPARFWALMSQQPHYLFMAAAGLALGFRRRPMRAWGAVLWGAIALAALIDHRPLWPHQLMLMFVPLAWMAGGVGAAVRRPLSPATAARIKAAVAAVALIAVVPFAVSNAGRTAERFTAPTDPIDSAAVAALSRYAAQTRRIVTDSPLDAYYAGLRTPPELAVISLKRVKGGTLTPEDVLAVIRRVQPEQVSYRRMFMGKPVLAYLKDAYDQVPDTRRQVLFVRRGLNAADK